jgi:autotransporter-associated beta strand protein
MKKRLIYLVAMLCATLGASAQRQTDKLDRGLVAVPSGSGSYVSWRIFGEEYYDTEYNLYRDGVKVNDKPLKVSNFVDSNGKSGSKYQVAPVVRGVEKEKCAEVTRLNQQYIQFAVKPVEARDGSNMTSDCNINDIALADLTGDGISEFIVKRNYGHDYDDTGNYPVTNKTRYNHIEVYNINGDRLWWIDLGPNMVSGPDEQYDAVGYDWDGDGKAEVLMRGADNMIIHCADGSVVNIGNMSVNTRNTVLHNDNNLAYTNSGNEYLLYLEGATGKPYPIGNNGQLWMTYPLPRGNAIDWGDSYGHRSTKHYFGAPCLDGRNAFIFLGRGCYTKHHMKAFRVDPLTHQLSLYWEWANNNGWADPWYGNGYHNFGIADVDWDGRDEICFGSMVIDDNGKGLSTTGLGHGDAQHCGDFDPYRHGQEIFACNEDEPAMNYRDATTSKIYYRLQTTSDDGRALCGNFSNDYPGAMGHSSQSATISCVADKPISGGPGGFTNNFRIYWDGDLLEEGLDGASSREGAARVFKANGTIVFTADGTANCNWTKNTPSATGDVLGDWREEIVVRTSDNRFIRVYTTNKVTNYRNYTLWHDHQYRQGMVWQSVGYNQPPHASYFLGELENITVAPPPYTMTDRTEVANGGTIDSSLDDKHVIVCETNDTKVTVAEGAKPWVATFNVPSWVQGTNSNVLNGGAKIDYTYYTCNVEGAAFNGPMHLTKQGDGILNLPAVEQKYTGETNIWAGTLNFDGKLLHSPVWMNRFAELNSNGGEFRSIRMEYDAKLRPGRADNAGTITTDSLMMGFGSRIIFDIFNDGLKSDQVNTKLLKIEKKDWEYGPKYLTPVFEFVAHNGTDEAPATGSYFLGNVEKLEGSLSNIKIEGLGTKLKTQLELTDGKLYLVIAGVRDPGTVTWTGATSAVWNMASAENFSHDGESDFFVTGDNVIFNDSGTKFTIQLSGELEPDTVFVDNTKSYSFNGSGSLVGNTTLVKRNTGMLTIKTDNTYKGGNRLSGGVVVVSSLANENQPAGNLGAVVNTGTKFLMENGAELRTTAAVTNGSPVRFETEDGGVINNQADYTVNKAMTGTVLRKKGSGTMRLNVSNSSLNRLIIQAGTVQCINANTPAKVVEYQGGTLRENTGSSYAVNVPSGKSGTWYLANRSTYTNTISGEGTLTMYCTTEKGTDYYATRTPIQCNFTNFKGTLKPMSSQDDAVKRFTLNTASGMPNGTMSIAADVEVQNSGRIFRIGRVGGTGKLGGSCTFDNNSSPGANTWQVGNDEDWSTQVKVTSNANFQKVGAGKVTWNAASENSGTTVVKEGELCLGTSAMLGTGRLTVEAGAVLSATGKTSKLNNSSANIGGTLAITATKCATATDGGCTTFNFSKALAVNGTIRITPAANNTLQVGDSIRIFTASSFSGTPAFEFLGGIEWDTSRISEGLLFVKALNNSIEGIVSEKTPRNIYDLRGRLVKQHATDLNGLKPGVYVCEGRKFVIKN